jgi:hypothetical protein
MNRHTQATQVQPQPLSLSKRRSLLALGSAGVIALLTAPTSSSVKARKKRKRRKKAAEACPPVVEDCTTEISQTCVKQKDECNAFFAPLCAEEDAPRNCTEAIAICCESLGTCQATFFLDCFMQIIRPVREPV